MPNSSPPKPAKIRAIGGAFFGVQVNTGDVILIMSDGLAERFNATNQMLDYLMLDYLEIKNNFASCGNQSPQSIIESLVSLGDKWGGCRPQDDDITFVAIKFS